MSIPPRYEYMIAPGYNNIAGLENFELIIPSLDRAFFAPVGYKTGRPGQRKRGPDGRGRFVGFRSCSLTIPGVTRPQDELLMDDYCDGDYEGEVTIQMRPFRSEYAIYNAIMSLPDPADQQRQFTVFPSYRINFLKLVWIAEAV